MCIRQFKEEGIIADVRPGTHLDTDQGESGRGDDCYQAFACRIKQGLPVN